MLVHARTPDLIIICAPLERACARMHTHAAFSVHMRQMCTGWGT